jgi:hypothetical protein
MSATDRLIHPVRSKETKRLQSYSLNGGVREEGIVDEATRKQEEQETAQMAAEGAIHGQGARTNP